MKQCSNCGAWNQDEARFCSSCGAPLPAPGPQPGYQNPNPRGDAAPGPEEGYGPYVAEHRSVAICIILSLVTCGIYTLYWLYKLNDELNLLAGNRQFTSGGMVILFDILTCGIYGVYWAYKMGQNVSRLNGDNYSPIVFLLLALFQCQFINLALMQDTANKCA